MSDVLRTAERYHSRLQAEIAKVDEFLAMAGSLMKMSKPEASEPALNLTTHVPSSELQPAEPLRTSVEVARTIAAEPEPAPATTARPSVVPVSFGPFESERDWNSAKPNISQAATVLGQRLLSLQSRSTQAPGESGNVA